MDISLIQIYLYLIQIHEEHVGVVLELYQTLTVYPTIVISRGIRIVNGTYFDWILHQAQSNAHLAVLLSGKW